MTDRITAIEEHLAHQNATLDELGQIVRAQAEAISLLQARVTLLLQRAAEVEADQQAAAPLADQRPPHY